MIHRLVRAASLALLVGSVLGYYGSAARAQQIRFLSAVEQPDQTTIWGDFDHGRAATRADLVRSALVSSVPQALHPAEGVIQSDHGYFRLAAHRQQPATDPVQPETRPSTDVQQPEVPPTTDVQQPDVSRPSPTDAGAAGSRFDFGIEPPARAQVAQGGAPGASGATGGEAIALGQADVGGLLSQSNSVNTVEVQRRSPVALDPNIRGYKQGQIYTQADNAYYFAARQDLDTQLSKIDPAMIQDVVVIPGPYGVKYGPGFSFIDIVTTPTPRNQDNQFRTILTWRGNGDQLFARETVDGGSGNFGYRFSYGHRLGVDYESGDDQRIPSGFQIRDVWGELGYSFDRWTRLEFQYLRVDQTDTEFAGQFFDIDYLVTDGYNLRLTDESPNGLWTGTTLAGWYNRTRFAGSTDQKRPGFPVLERAEIALDDFIGAPRGSSTVRGLTDGDVVSTGARGSIMFGDKACTHLQVGADFRYLEQQIAEQFTLDNPIVIFPIINTNMPRSWLVDEGLYAELKVPVSSFWKATAGARVDFVHTDARDEEVMIPGTALPGGTAFLTQDDTLGAMFLSNEVMLNQYWTFRAGVGHAQRTPTLIERYSDGLFLGIIQSGFTRVIGDPTLDKERSTQIDVGLEANYDNVRSRGTMYYAWINDYITLGDDRVQVPVNFTDARLLRFQNTDQATLAGFEWATEVDVSRMVTPFATMRFVEGRDQQINAPLPAISPLEATVGGRLHDPCGGRRWSVEMACRIVDDQDRLGGVRLAGQTQALEERTPGFNVWHIRGFYNYSRNLHFVGGVDNLFDRVYQQHLDLRFVGQQDVFRPTRVLAPGVTPYIGVDWTF